MPDLYFSPGRLGRENPTRRRLHCVSRMLHGRNAIRVLDVLRAIALPDIPWPRAEIDLLHEGQLGIFRAARVLQQQVLFGKGLTCSRQHPILSERALSCKKCHSTKCFSHVLADCYIHSASALHLYSQDKTHQDCHNYHLSNRSKFAGQVSTGSPCCRIQQVQAVEGNATTAWLVRHLCRNPRGYKYRHKQTDRSRLGLRC
ncbi:hypothetical protein BD779DRAFT_1190037 [Infundibulicybe gibba]|nr:hypothetical protein BD779DRAFT_1190037 [Infundibulicybe gibba]